MGNMYDQHITLDISGRNNGPLIHAKQGDADSRSITISLVENGSPFPVENGASVEFRCHKPSGYVCDNPAAVNDDGSITVILTEQSLAEAGMVIADVAIRSGSGKILSSSNFHIRVTEAASNGEKLDSSNELLILNKLVQDASAIVEEYNDTLDAVTPSIGQNGNWYVGENDTGVKAEGKDGQDGEPGQPGEPGADGATPEIGENGNWWIDGADTGKPSQGQVDMTEVEDYVDEKKSSITVTLPVSGWADNTQTAAAGGVLADNDVIVSPAPASFMAYAEAVVRATAQGAGTLTFTCESVPAGDLAVNVVILN